MGRGWGSCRSTLGESGTHVHGGGVPTVAPAIGEAHGPHGAAASLPEDPKLVVHGAGRPWGGTREAAQRSALARRPLPPATSCVPRPWQTRPLTVLGWGLGAGEAAAVLAQPSLVL